MVWMVQGSNPSGGEIFHTHPEKPRGPPSLLYDGYWVFPGCKAAGAWRGFDHSPPSSAEVKERAALVAKFVVNFYYVSIPFVI